MRDKRRVGRWKGRREEVCRHRDKMRSRSRGKGELQEKGKEEEGSGRKDVR
jgi:hypothetical protein